MVAVLKEKKAMTASELGEYIRINDLYKQKDGTPLKDSQYMLVLVIALICL